MALYTKERFSLPVFLIFLASSQVQLSEKNQFLCQYSKGVLVASVLWLPLKLAPNLSRDWGAALVRLASSFAI